MSLTIDYFLAPISPWTYLGHERFVRMAAEAGATVRLKPMDLGKVFPVSGGLPLGKRAPQRQAYRLVELARFRDFLGLPMNVQPKFFPAPGDDASRLLIAVDQADGTAAALKLAGAIMAAVWAQERNIADTATLAALLAECGLPPDRAEASNAAAVQTAYEGFTQQAIDVGVFGAPTYVLDGEVFWGQDRLELLRWRLSRR
jgi:2-hydroxychromene-2-carboxylate isomerase